MILNKTSNVFLKELSFAILLLLFEIFTTSFPLASENHQVTNLFLKQKALYLAVCDFDGNGLKDFIVADKNNLTIYLQQPKLSFRTLYVELNEKIIALSSFGTGEKSKENIICLGENIIFYFSWDSRGKIVGPKYIKTKQRFLEKQRNFKNNIFISDLNKDNLEDIIIPVFDGLLIIWQVEPLVFRPYIIPIEDNQTSNNNNINPWPKGGLNNERLRGGFSFFPSNIKKTDYWFQDFDKDHLLDIFTINISSDIPEIKIFLQNKNMKFNLPRRITFNKTDYSQFNPSNMSFVDLNNDGLLEITTKDIVGPLQNSDSLLPISILKTYYPISKYYYSLSPKEVLRSVFIPGLNNIQDLDDDELYEFIIATSSLRLSSKESIIKVATNQELNFSLGYLKNDYNKNKIMQKVELNKIFSVTIPDLNSLDNFGHLIRIEDVNGDNIPDIIMVKKMNVLEFSLLGAKNGALVIKRNIQITLPYPFSEIELLDIDSDGKKEILIVDSSQKILSVVSLN